MLKTCQILVLAVGKYRKPEDAAVFITYISQKFDDFLVLSFKCIIKDNKRSKFHIIFKAIPGDMHELFFSMIDNLSVPKVHIVLLVRLEHQQLDLLPLLHQTLSEGCIDIHPILVLAPHVPREVLLLTQNVELCKHVFQLVFVEDSPRTKPGLVFWVFVNEPPDAVGRTVEDDLRIVQCLLVLEIIFE